MDNSLSSAFVHTSLIIGSGVVLFYLIFFLVRLWSKTKKNSIPPLISKYLHFPGLFLFIAIAINLSLRAFDDIIDHDLYSTLNHIGRVILIVAIGYFIIMLVTFLKDLILKFYERRKYKDYTFRSAKTKFTLIQRIINFAVTVFMIAAVLMTFEQVRQLGGTLLASAGVAGLVLGFAAQKSLGSLFAGIQIAISQPIKIDDTVVVEDTFGTIGEITLTYVVINTWDEKRLIIPVTYFLEEPFENWTRESPEVVGNVKIYTDYTLPVDKLRKEFEKWLTESPLWDKRKGALLVTDAREKTIEVRATMSAKNSDDAFDLECLIREKLISYIREHYPQALPAERISVTNVDNKVKTV